MARTQIPGKQVADDSVASEDIKDRSIQRVDIGFEQVYLEHLEPNFVLPADMGGTGGTSGSVENFLGLNDTPAAYTGSGKFLVRVKEDGTGLEFFDPPIQDPEDPPPEIGGTIWYDLTTGISYAVDPTRGNKLLSLSRDYPKYFDQNPAKGTYLLHQSSVWPLSLGYPILTPSTIIRIAARSLDGDLNHLFYVRDYQTDLFSFQMTNGVYTSNLNYDLTPGTRMRIFVDGGGNAVKETGVIVEIALRYVP